MREITRASRGPLGPRGVDDGGDERVDGRRLVLGRDGDLEREGLGPHGRERRVLRRAAVDGLVVLGHAAAEAAVDERVDEVLERAEVRAGVPRPRELEEREGHVVGVVGDERELRVGLGRREDEDELRLEAPRVLPEPRERRVLGDERERREPRGAVEGRRRRGEAVARARQPLVVDDLLRAHAEAAQRPKGRRHVDGRDLHGFRVRDVEELLDAPARRPEHADAQRLVEDEAVAVGVLEPEQLVERRDVADVARHGLADDEAALRARRAALGRVVGGDGRQHPLEVAGVVVLVGQHRGPRQHAARAQRLADAVVDDEQVAALRERRDRRRAAARRVAEGDGALDAQERRDLDLELLVDVDGPVEAAGAAGPAAVLGQRRGGRVADLARAGHAQEVEGRAI
mmetsp:Transcript_11490/g.37655  ORF Transcript_11490/g.37655 Transcript_11490/m.37655 type:complete len:401 (-) Transcript_11490:452-1654(-)